MSATYFFFNFDTPPDRYVPWTDEANLPPFGSLREVLDRLNVHFDNPNWVFHGPYITGNGNLNGVRTEFYFPEEEPVKSIQFTTSIKISPATRTALQEICEIEKWVCYDGQLRKFL